MSLESSVSFWDALSFWLITAGVILTFVGAGASIIFRRYNHELVVLTEEHNRQEAQARNKAIADAGVRAAEANAYAKEAEARAAEANLELAKFKAPRTLTAEQSQHITESVRPFAGTQFTVAVFNDPEPINLMSQIESALISAGWVETVWKGGGDIGLTRPGFPNVGFTLTQGVFVQADNSHAANLRSAVATLASALTTEGVPTKPEIGQMPPNTNNSVVQILVGKKP